MRLAPTASTARPFAVAGMVAPVPQWMVRASAGKVTLVLSQGWLGGSRNPVACTEFLLNNFRRSGTPLLLLL